MSKDVKYQGGWFAQRGLAMYKEVERITPFDFFVSQGGYNAGGVAASAGTHDREAVDISGSLLTPDERWTYARTCAASAGLPGFGLPTQGFSWHLHGVPIGGDLSAGASAQVVQYLDRKNGLAGARPGRRAARVLRHDAGRSTQALRPTGRPSTPETRRTNLTPEQDKKLNDMDLRIKDLHAAMSAIGGNGDAERFRPFFRRAATDGTFDVVKAEGNRGLGAKLDSIMRKLGI